MRKTEFVDIRSTNIPLLTVRPDFSGAVYEGLGNALASRSGVESTPVIQTLQQTGGFIQKVLARLYREDIGLTEGLDRLNRDEQAVATSMFVTRIYGKELAVDSNLYKLNDSIRGAAEWRSGLYTLGNIGRQRFGSGQYRLDRISCFVMGLEDGPSRKDPWFTYKVGYRPTNMVLQDKTVRAEERILISGGLITPEQWSAQGNETQTKHHSWIARQNFLAENPKLGQEAQRLITAYHQWLPGR